MGIDPAETEIFYFSGTGNSLFVAKELAKRIPHSRVRPIISCLGQDAIRTGGDVMGLVFPVHAMAVPTPVKQFLRRADLRSAKYVFAIATRLGLVFEDFGAVDRLLRKQGLRLDARFILTMGSNDAKSEGYHCPTDAVIATFEADVLRRLDEIAKVVGNRERHRPKDTEFTIGLPYGRLRNRLFERFIIFLKTLSERTGGVNYYYADDTCTGCGICERICLSGKIVMTGGRPKWRKEILCHMCYACLNFCPKQAVQIKGIRGVVRSFTPINERYSHPYATVKDIVEQKYGDEETE